MVTRPIAPAPRDHGSGTLLVLAMITVLMAVAAVTVPLLAVLALRPSVLAAADAAALAAADTASGAVWGHPCERAAQAAELGGATLTACSLDQYTATVTVTRTALGFELAARSRAGPPQPTAQPGSQSNPDHSTTRIPVQPRPRHTRPLGLWRQPVSATTATIATHRHKHTLAASDRLATTVKRARTVPSGASLRVRGGPAGHTLG